MARILVVDDDPTFRLLVQVWLKEEGYNVQTAGGVEEALALYRADPFDLVITDMVMPVRGGVSFIMDIRRDYPHARILAMSGGDYVDPEDYLRLAQSLGAVRVLTKPFEVQDFLQAVREALGSTN